MTFAFFASITVALAQPFATKYSAPQTVSCETDALHPSAGVPYTYSMAADPSTGTWNWFATKNPAFIASGVLATDSLQTDVANQLLEASDNYGKEGSSNSVSITWSDAILSGTSYQGDPAPGTPTFVVGYFKGDGTTVCADNIKVYEINPVHAFVVDIYNLDPEDLTDAVSTEVAQCVDNVQGATYSGGTITYDYGTNYLYYEFVAANFTNYWIPTFALTTPDAAQVITTEFTYSHPDTWGTTPPVWNTLTSGSTQLQVDPSVTNTSEGVSVFVRVTVEHKTFEMADADQVLTMTLDGQNSLLQWDVVNDTCVDPDAADQNDFIDQRIKRRPAITDNTPDVNMDDPNDVIPSNP